MRIGFREARFTPEGFFLNGQRVKLRGVNRHQTYPYVGGAMPERVQRKDADIIKHELKCNVVRTSHYPQSPHFLDRCDEIGLLVVEEIPGWQHIGGPRWQDLSYRDVASMVRRDRNRPSVILWNVRINESADSHDFYARTNEIARGLDDSRPTGGTRDFADSELLEDVFTINDFDPYALRPPHHEHYLNTEYAGHTFPTKSYDNADRVQEHVLRHAWILDQLAANDGYAGGIASDAPACASGVTRRRLAAWCHDSGGRRPGVAAQARDQGHGRRRCRRSDMGPDPDYHAVRAVLDGMHRVLLHVAGRLPDDVLAAARQQLADTEWFDLAHAVSVELVTRQIPVLREDVSAIAGMHRAFTGEEPPEPVERIPVVAAIPPTPHRFTTDPDDNGPAAAAPAGHDQPDYIAVEFVRRLPGAVALRRAWRSHTDEPAPRERVYVVELSPGLEPWGVFVAGELQRDLSGAGEDPPRVEVYASDENLAPYQRGARDGGELLWSAAETTGPVRPEVLSGRHQIDQAIAAAREGRVDDVRSLVDWSLTSAPHLAAALAEFEPYARGIPASGLGLLITADDPDDIRFDPDVVTAPLRQLMRFLGTAEAVVLPDETERREWLSVMQVPPVPPDGMTGDQIARLSRLRERAAALTEVYLVRTQGMVLPLAIAPDTGKLVAVVG